MHRDYTYIHISLYEHLAKGSDGESNVTKRRVNIHIYIVIRGPESQLQINAKPSLDVWLLQHYNSFGR